MKSSELNRIIQNKEISIKYQAIICLKTGQILGYEALCRGPINSTLHNPIKLFQVADEVNKSLELNYLCIKKAIENVSKGYDKLLFINVDMDFFVNKKYIECVNTKLLDNDKLSSHRLVYELTERKESDDKEKLKKCLDIYMRNGNKIAIDDIGTSFSGLKRLVEIKPQYIKLDKDLIRDINKDYYKYSLIKTFVEFAKATEIIVIAEGIETKQELTTLIKLGVNCGQGYYIQYPCNGLEGLDNKIVNCIQQYSEELRV